MTVFNEPTKWATTLGQTADVANIPDTAGETDPSIDKIFPSVFSVPLKSGGKAVPRTVLNALFKLLGDWCFYSQNGGLASYDADFDYAVGRVVLYGNDLYKCIQANGTSSTVVAPDSVSPAGTDYWDKIAQASAFVDLTSAQTISGLKTFTTLPQSSVTPTNDDDFITKKYFEDNQAVSLIPNQIITSPVPLTDANLHLLDGALLSGSGAYADYVSMMSELYTADPTATCWTDEATWQSSVTTYGECGKFVYDSVNNTLRLPKLSSFVQATTTASELGTLVEAGAPNITGTSNVSQCRIIDPNTGVFSGSINGNNNVYPSSELYGANIQTLDFNASNSNSIYGNSNTIQPQAIKYYFYIVVGTVSKTDIQIDIDNVMTDLALKADKDFSNATPNQAFINTSIEWGQPDYSSAIAITLTLNSAVTYNVLTDGFIVYTLTGSVSIDAQITVNGADVINFKSSSGSFVEVASGIVPVHKGDVVTIQGHGADSGWLIRGLNYAEFVPCKGAN